MLYFLNSLLEITGYCERGIISKLYTEPKVIRWIDCGGPADKSGLQIGDRIIEVNGHSVEYECHKRLISCLSLNPTETHFLVVDEDYDRAYKR